MIVNPEVVEVYASWKQSTRKSARNNLL